MSAKEFSMGRRWLIFSTVFLVGVLASFCMFKAPPLFSTEFMTDLGFSDSNIGWVMSMFAMIGVVLAFPAGGILQKLGPKKSLIITAASLVIGAGLGALATDVVFMLATRFIEGVGMGLISVVGPAAVASIIPARKQGLAMGIWSVWFPCGVVAAFNLAPLLYSVGGSWQIAWWFAAVLSVIALILVVLVYADPPAEGVSDAVQSSSTIQLKPDMFSIIMVALAFCAWNIINAGAISGFYPSYLADVHHLGTQMAGTVSSFTNILVLALGPISGLVADKLSQKFNIRKAYIVLALFAAAGLLCFGFGDSMTLVWVFVSLMAFASAACATGVFSSIPLLAKDSAKIGFGMAIVAFLQNVGILVGSAAFAPIVATLGWNMASIAFCVPVCVVGAIFAILIKSAKAKSTAE